MKGPAPKPTALKELAGTVRKDRARQREPKPRVVAPPCPAWLVGEARKEYKRTARLLVRTRVLTEADRTALAAYAYEVGEWLKQCRILEGEPEILTSDKGGMYLNPRVGLVNLHMKNMLKLMAEFGLTPASRTRIEAQVEEQETSLADALFASVTHAD